MTNAPLRKKGLAGRLCSWWLRDALAQLLSVSVPYPIRPSTPGSRGGAQAGSPPQRRLPLDPLSEDERRRPRALRWLILMCSNCLAPVVGSLSQWNLFAIKPPPEQIEAAAARARVTARVDFMEEGEQVFGMTAHCRSTPSSACTRTRGLAGSPDPWRTSSGRRTTSSSCWCFLAASVGSTHIEPDKTAALCGS